MSSFLHRLKTERKTQSLFALGFVAFIFLGTVIALFVFFNNSPSEIGNEEGRIAGQVRKLDGLPVSEREQADGYPVAVIIENLESVRPQSGLSRAGVVYEALAEGGITRFMALYSHADAEKIGPVRSARSYFVDIASEYNPLFVHAGGSPDALAKIPQAELIDLNQIGGDESYFWRDPVLRAPHNLFTQAQFLTFALRDKKLLSKKSTYDAWLFTDDLQSSQRPSDVADIIIPFSSKDYEVRYEYDVETNSYFRYNGGSAHVDELTGEHISPKNIIVQFVEQRVLDEEGRLEIDVVGQGDALVFKDGVYMEVQWMKESAQSRTQFVDDSGKDIKFTRGQTWVEIVPQEKEIIY